MLLRFGANVSPTILFIAEILHYRHRSKEDIVIFAKDTVVKDVCEIGQKLCGFYIFIYCS